MLPPAPERLSTTMVWPSTRPSGSARRRAKMSVPAPVGKPPMIWIGRSFGHSCAAAVESAAKATSIAPATAPRRMSDMGSPLFFLEGLLPGPPEGWHDDRDEQERGA